MMPMAAPPASRLIDRLPPVRGRLSENAALAGITWFRVGGPAEVMFRPADREDLRAFLRAKPADVPVTVVGVGSNLLVRDGGVPGVVLRLGRGFVEIEADGNDLLCGAGALDLNVATYARRAGLGGLEFLCGVPGTLGGALRMNAGAYDKEIKDVVVWAEAVDTEGRVHRLDATSPVSNITQLGTRYGGFFEREHLNWVDVEDGTAYIADSGHPGYGDTPPRVQSIPVAGGPFTDLYVGTLPDFAPGGIAIGGDTIYLSPQMDQIHKFDEKGLRIA